MILNPFKCENCKEELQPDMIGIETIDGKLVRVCMFCGNEIFIDNPEKSEN